MEYQEVITNVGKRIRTFRLDKKMTQLDLASKCAIEQTNLARIELGKTSPTLRTLFTIAEALEVDIKDLL